MLNQTRTSEQGKAVIVVLVALVLVAVAGLGYMTGNLKLPGEKGTQDAAVAVASGEPAGGEAKADAQKSAEAEATVIKEGNPVVAKVGGKDVSRLDVLQFIRTLPPNLQQLPAKDLFPLATQQFVNSKVIGEKVKGVNLDNDDAVKAQLAAAKDQIVRTVFMQKQVDKAMTDARLKAAYEEYKKNFPDIDEVKARHILVKDEKLAKDLIKQIKDGADFAELAKAKSIDATKDKGGALNYFAKQEVVPPFAEAAFSQKIGEVSAKPVKSDFGYHIVEVQDKRKRPPAEFEVAKPFLAAQLQNVVLNEIIQKWRNDAKVEIFDINGDAIEPAAGE